MVDELQDSSLFNYWTGTNSPICGMISDGWVPLTFQILILCPQCGNSHDEMDHESDVILPPPLTPSLPPTPPPPPPQPPKRPRNKRSKDALIRPRVPKERHIILKHATPATLSEMKLQRSRKIGSAENRVTVGLIKELEAQLEKDGDLKRALENREPLPFKNVYDIPNKKLQDALNRKATDHFNKRQFAWNEAELKRLQEFIKHKHKLDALMLIC